MNDTAPHITTAYIESAQGSVVRADLREPAILILCTENVTCAIASYPNQARPQKRLARRRNDDLTDRRNT